MKLNILYVGVGGGTCHQRAEALRELGHHVRHVVSEAPDGFLMAQLYRAVNRTGRPPDFRGANRTILRAVASGGIDLMWIDKGRSVRPRTLAQVRQSSPRTILIAYSPDDMMNPQNQSTYYLRGLPLYDMHVTTKSYNVRELKELGARDVLFIDNAFDPATHRPIDLTPEEQRKYGADIGFIGGFEADRAARMLRLAEEGLEVNVWGYAWKLFKESHPRLRIRDEMLDGQEYAKAICATKINLGFLRKVNRDLQTTRSIEIPGCRAFMLAERTDEHLKLFEEGREAEFFSSFEELLSKCRHYLENEQERLRIAAAGYRRCIEGGYSNRDRLAGVISTALERYTRPRAGS